MKQLIFTLSIFLLLFSQANARSNLWRINKDHSEILFKVGYLNISEVTGSFARFDGRVKFDDDLVLANHIDIQINADSIYTGNDMRDGHLKSSDFLKAQDFPHITFISDKITPIAPSRFRADGELTIKDIKKPFSIEYELSEMVSDTWNYKNKFVRFNGIIDREEFHLQWNKTLQDNKYLISNKVEFSGSFQIQPASKLTPGSKHMIPNTKYVQNKDKLVRGEITQKEFDSQIQASTNNKALAKAHTTLPESPNLLPVNSNQNSSGDFRSDIKWQISFGIMAFLGFFASIILGVHAKYFLNSFFKAKYEETGVLGNLSDILAYGYAIAYAVSIWYVGWGT